MRFISDTNRAYHEEYLRNQRLRLSIFEKSYPQIVGKDYKALTGIRLPKGEREELLKIKKDILSHEVFFSSFGVSNEKCEAVKKQYGSEASFLYLLFCECNKCDGNFLYVYTDRTGGVRYTVDGGAFVDFSPVLAVDLCEHAYFYDYGFDRSKYLKAALSEINLLKIANTVEKTRK